MKHDPEQQARVTDAPDAAEIVEESPTTGDGRHLEAVVEERFASLERRLEERFRADTAKDRQIDRLHAELQEQKKDLLARAVRPVLSRVMRLHGTVSRTVEGFRDGPPEELNPERLLGALEGFGDDLELLLADHGVGTFEHPGTTFDPHRQTAVLLVDTEDAAEVGEIARRVGPGFELGDAILQKERVAVYRATSMERETA